MQILSYPQILIFIRNKNIFVHNILHLAWKYARMFVCWHYLFREAHGLQGEISKHIFTQSGSYCVYHPTSTPSFVNRGISEDLPAPTRCRRHTWREAIENKRNEEKNKKTIGSWGGVLLWRVLCLLHQVGAHLPRFLVGNIRSRDAFRPIADERK